VIGGALLLAAGAVAGLLLWPNNTDRNRQGGPPAASGKTIRLSGVTAYDPQGDGAEHNDVVSQATDGNSSTYWNTDHYASQTFGNLKRGVGLVLDASRALEPKAITVRTDTPGFTALIEAGDSESGPFSGVSASQTMQASTSFSLDLSSPKRYFVVWITRLGPGDVAHVNEVRATE
jgi:hypothetical protein